MVLYTDASIVTQYNLNGNAVIDSLLFSTPQFRNAWSTQSGGVYQVTYSLPYTTNPAALWHSGYGSEPTAGVVHGADATAQAAIATAFAAWGAVAKINFTQVAETNDGQVGDIRIAFSSQVSGGNWGYAKLVSNGGLNMHGDIWIAPDVAADPWYVGSFNYTAIMHEIGHSLGLQHPFEGNIAPPGYDNGRYTIMSYTDPNNVWYFNPSTGEFEYLLLTPMVYDIAAIQHIYGANMSHNAGNTLYTYLRDEPFFLTIWDGGGNDTIDVSDFTNGCVIDLTPGSYSTTRFSNHNVTQNLGIAFNCYIENAIGGFGADTIKGQIKNNRLYGLEGNDALLGMDGNDFLRGGEGDDKLVGGPGIDTADYIDAAAGVQVSLTDGTAGTNGGGNAANIGADQLLTIENVIGSIYADLLIGSAAANQLQAFGGNDRLEGYGGNDTLDGGNGRDILFGGNGNDTLRGGAQNDIFNGGANDDILHGGTGRDHMVGGLGADRFVFDDGEMPGLSATTCDDIGDFVRAQGDKIDLSLVDATPGGADDAFTFIGAASSGSVGQLWYVQTGGDTYIQGELNGAAGADFWIKVTGNIAFVGTDFVL